MILSGRETLQEAHRVKNIIIVTFHNNVMMTAMKPHPCRMTLASAATFSSYITTSLSELFAFLLRQKDTKVWKTFQVPRYPIMQFLLKGD